MAGLETVPCIVSDMDEKEQTSVMLLENIQRSDLTVYEQAQGFQMMLDLGETDYHRLRSADRGKSCVAWYVYSSGYVGSGITAYWAYRCAPACTIA